MNVRPLFDRILVQRNEEPTKTKTTPTRRFVRAEKPTGPSQPAPARVVSPSRSGRRPSMPVLVLAIALIALAAAAIAGAVLSGGDDGSSPSANNPPAAPAKKKPAEPKKKPKAKKETPKKAEEPPASAPSTGDESTSYDPARGAQLNSQGFDLMNQGDYDAAIPVLQQAVKSFPPGTSDLNYAYALFNLGKSLRLGGRPDEAIPVLEQRLQIPNQTGTVQRELDLAKQQAGQG